MEKIDSKENLIRLIEQYQNLVFSICLKMLGDYFTAEDITQDTFVSAYSHLQSFDGVNEKAWICRIATNKCLDYKKATARQVIPFDESIEESLAGDLEPLQEILNKEVVEELSKAIERLEQPYRDVAYKHFIEGMTAKEISIQKDVGIKTVQTHIYRARDMLKKYIRKEDLKYE